MRLAGGSIRREPGHPFGIGDRPGRDAIDANVRPPFQRQHPDQLVDPGLGGAGMGLKRGRIDRLTCGNGNQRRARQVQQIMTPPKHIERPVQINVDNGAKGVGRHPQNGGQEIACRARNDNVHLPEPVDNGFHRRADRCIVAHIGR